MERAGTQGLPSQRLANQHRRPPTLQADYLHDGDYLHNGDYLHDGDYFHNGRLLRSRNRHAVFNVSYY